MVERYRCFGWDIRRGEMKPRGDGEWVLYSDYAALERKIAELRAKCDVQLAETQRAWNERDGEKRKRLAAEAENARLRAPPLKDEVERVEKECLFASEEARKSNGRSTYYSQVLDKAADLLSRLRAGEKEGWRPIETAPKDGSRFLAWDGFSVFLCNYNGGWQDEPTCSGRPHTKAWMPLPASPSVSEGGNRNG